MLIPRTCVAIPAVCNPKITPARVPPEPVACRIVSGRMRSALNLATKFGGTVDVTLCA